MIHKYECSINASKMVLSGSFQRAIWIAAPPTKNTIARAELTAVSDAFPTNLEKYKQFKTFESSEKLIRSGEVDAVIIATPHYLHTSIGIDALQSGLHVLVEKPISVHKADCERLI